MAIVRTLWNFITALKNTVGNLLFLALLGLIIFALFSQQRIQVPESAVLIIDPEGLIVNQKRAVDPIEGFLTGGQAEAEETLGRDIIDAIRAATDDERIKGIVLDLSKLAGSSLSLYDEIGRELLTFKQTDKPVYAFGSSYSQTQYFLAAYADKIYVDADAHSFLGGVFLQGFGSYPLYLKDALDKLSLSIHIFKAGVFKDAAETLTRQSMSEHSREANQLLVDSLWQQYLGTVSEQRGISAHAISNYIENYAEIMDAADADFVQASIEQGLVDEAITRSAWRKKIQELSGESGDTYNHINFRSYLAATRPTVPIENLGSDKIAVIVASGIILDGDQPPGQVGGDSVALLIRKARNNDSIKAIVLRVDSPGGSASASELIRSELALTQESGKPVVASFSGVAASGGYWIASTANQIYATSATVTGSIGVITIFPTIEQSLEKLGIESDGVGTTILSGAFDSTRAINPVFAKAVQLSVDHTYNKFLSLVAEGRGMTMAEADVIGQGRVWTGNQAIEHGLIDALGGMDDAVGSAAMLAGLDDYEIIYMEKELSPQEQLLQQILHSTVSLDAGLPSHVLPLLQRELSSLMTIIRHPGIYLQCLACSVTF